MPFVKLDCEMLESTTWMDVAASRIFVTALLMASPGELEKDTEQLEVREYKGTGYIIPAGFYGFVRASADGIVSHSKLEEEEGLAALERLCAPEKKSRSPEYEGRRMARVGRDYLVLNFMKFRDRDMTAAVRAKRWRERQKMRSHSAAFVTRDETGDTRDSRRRETRAEAEADNTLRASARKGVFWDNDDPPTTKEEQVAISLYQGLGHLNVIMRPPSLKKWAAELRTFRQETKVSRAYFERVMAWGLAHHRDHFGYKFFSMDSFLAKFPAISTAMERLGTATDSALPSDNEQARILREAGQA